VLFRVSSCVCLHWARTRVVGMLVRGGSPESLMLPCIERWHPPLKTNTFPHILQKHIVHTPSHPTTRHIPLSNNASNVGPPTSNSIFSYTWFALPVHSAQGQTASRFSLAQVCHRGHVGLIARTPPPSALDAHTAPALRLDLRRETVSKEH